MGLLTDFRLTVSEKHFGVYGVHVHQNGKTIAEHRFRSDDRENLCSASKTFVSVGIGIAVYEQLLSTDDYVLDYFPEYREMATSGTEKMTVENLLMMATGHIDDGDAAPQMVDRAAHFFSTEVKTEPGTRFYYEDLASYMLGRIIEKVSGERLLEYLKPRLFDKLGIFNPQWHTCPLGHTSCSGGLYLTTEEFSRLGILLLNKGKIGDQQLLSPEFIDQMHGKLIDTSAKMDSETQQGYGYQVWKCTIPNAYRADGMYGQYCVVLEDYQAVVTVTGHYEENGKDILRAVWKDILPQLSRA